jgi:hypothetical protein
MKPLSIKGLDKGALLKALYDRAKPLGLGQLHYDPAPMRLDKARAIIEERLETRAALVQARAVVAERLGSADDPGLEPRCLYFDYVGGRVLKVDLSGDELDPVLYDRDNGEGAADEAVSLVVALQPMLEKLGR